MRETEQGRGAQAEASPEVAEQAHELSVSRTKFTTATGDGVPPVASDTTAPKPTASDRAYLTDALEPMYSQLAKNNKDQEKSDEIDGLIKAIRAEVAKRSALAQKIETLLPTIMAAVDAEDETVIAPIKGDLEALGLYPAVVAAVAPTKRHPKALDHR